MCACCLGVLDQMSATHQEILRRVDLGEESLTAVAAELGISPNTAAVRLHRARKGLSEALLAHCGTSSLRACLDCGCEEAGNG